MDAIRLFTVGIGWHPFKNNPSDTDSIAWSDSMLKLNIFILSRKKI